MPDWTITINDSMQHAMSALNRCQKGVVVVLDEDQRLTGTISDGDLRRAVLDGLGLETQVCDVLKRKAGTRYEHPTVASEDTPDEELLRLMQDNEINLIPIVDDNMQVMRVVTMDDFVKDLRLPVQAVIMAGGFGKRLRPLTDDTPKPMLPIAGRPLMERTIERLRDAGIGSISVTTHYLPEKIKSHFGCGRDFGVNLNYVAEDEPLGTAGSLNMLGETDEPLLVMNGDILTGIDFRALLSFHRDHQADLTVAVRQFDVEVPYGVVEAETGIVTRLREKPKFSFMVNAGVYLMEPAARRLIPNGQRFDMTDLITKLIEAGHKVASFPIVEYWLDIGRHDDFEQAQDDVAQLKLAS